MNTRTIDPSNAAAWLDGLDAEAELLVELERTAVEARHSPIQTTDPRFAKAIERQAELCGRLEARRAERVRVLQTFDKRPSDLLALIQSALPKAEHPDAIARFSAYVAAAEAAQRQIRINGEYFGAALSAVEDVLGASNPNSTAAGTYDPRRRAPKTSTGSAIGLSPLT